MLELFEHNQIAFEAAKKMLKETGKAAVIHPTGTGKSFIAFKLAEENPSACFCWLSPSEYIFKTQTENLKKATGIVPGNIQFYTYARMMLMEKEQLQRIQPDYIILDEFHRCGASKWSKGVERLLDMYPKAAVLGLTATNIRYLDHQRDMADELFDGCIAHQMTLGEAVVCGALPAPKYVVSLFSYQKDLERYTRRVRQAGGAVQLVSEKYLDQLRRKLEKAQGMENVFEKHMPNRQGKYLVFCSCVEHMEMMLDKVPAWFSGIDKAPHIYRVYAENGASRTEYKEFQEDESAHLKLLFCIDMLNEGIHVDDLDGVILFRPTESPIIYKQQIGRALSASGKNTPVIFDLVNNVDHLYAISALRAEMEEVISYYRNHHRENDIVHSDFQVIDEVREYKELFDQLEATLTASWDMMYAEAAAFYRANGHLDIPRRYRTEANLPLGNWIMTQRTVRRGTKSGILTEEQIKKLDAIGMIWESPHEMRWETGYAHARKYWEQQGHLLVPYAFETEGFPLGAWIAQMRYQRMAPNRHRLTEEQVQKLDAIGMVWNKVDIAFEQGYEVARHFFEENGHLDVPAAYVSENGYKLGAWLGKLRERKDHLPSDQMDRMEKLGMNWQGRFEQKWEKAFAIAVDYAEGNGHLNPSDNERPEGFHLRRWLNQQQKAWQKLSEQQKEKLLRIGFSLNRDDPWEKQYQQAEAYYRLYGHLDIPADYVAANGEKVGEWLREQRKERTVRQLTASQVRRLNAIGMRWEGTHKQQWQTGYDAAKAYWDTHGHLRVAASFVTEDGFRLGNWLNAQKRRYYAGKLEEDRVKCLLQIGADWIDLQTIIPAPDARMPALARKNQSERKNKAM